MYGALILFLLTTGAWTASVQNSQQYLGVDLGASYIVTKVYTQGRQGSDEFVTEYTLEYSMDNNTWAEYTNEFGLTEVCNVLIIYHIHQLFN